MKLLSDKVDGVSAAISSVSSAGIRRVTLSVRGEEFYDEEFLRQAELSDFNSWWGEDKVSIVSDHHNTNAAALESHKHGYRPVVTNIFQTSLFKSKYNIQYILSECLCGLIL